MDYFCQNRRVDLKESELKQVDILGLPSFYVCPLCNAPKCLEEIVE
jgi:hypothetical protein